MVGARPKRGEGMGRAAAADVLGGWVGMVPAVARRRPRGRTCRTRRGSPNGRQRAGGLWSAPLSGMHTHVPREKERGRRQAGSACACSGFIWPNFRM